MDDGALADPKTKVVLVVDDDEDYRVCVEMFLRKEGYQVRHAGSGNEALALVEKNPPDLIITDLMMPDAGGYEVLRGLQSVAGARIPVVVNTARKLSDAHSQMLRAESNVVDILQKPISFPLLLALIARALKTRPPDAEPL